MKQQKIKKKTKPAEPRKAKEQTATTQVKTGRAKEQSKFRRASSQVEPVKCGERGGSLV